MTPSPESLDDAADALDGQPLARVARDGVEYTLLGTAHVSRASVTAVRSLIGTGDFDAIAVELCDTRYRALRDREAWRNLDLLQVIREGKAGMVAANLALSAYQRRLAEQFGIEPGAEMKAAADLAEECQRPLWLVDREISVTLRRAYRSVGFWDRLGILPGLVASLFERGEVAEADIEKLKHGDMLQSAFSEFAQQSEPLFRSLIGERDIFMTARLREESAKHPCKRVLVVIGAGHLAGIQRELQEQQDPPEALLAALKATPPAARWPRWIAYGVLATIVAAIIYAFARGGGLGAVALRDWVLFTGCGAALGALLGGGHPLTVLAAFVVAPLKPFRPLVPSGALSAAVEMWLRRPRVADFEALRDDVIDWRGWWKNRVSRTLLIFMFTNFGMMIGEYMAGFRILHRLM
ncbi:MAG: TraB/GumN family protein [Rudaea sp.]|nr:TraB/GumN family protein [Rudaea sp.]